MMKSTKQLFFQDYKAQLTMYTDYEWNHTNDSSLLFIVEDPLPYPHHSRGS